ncbi:MAG: DUF4440 domain-containing protein [Parvularculaceae bacterium]|nr:DUF4440 domain-containing protein [Parvularculaceae bacterium]
MAITAFLFIVAAQGATAPMPMPTGDELRQRIEEADAKLFWAAFEGCDADALAQIITPEFRMLHDLGGLAIESGAQMVDDARENCAARGPGGENEGYKNRRQITPGTRVVRALGDWGALEEAAHAFFEWRQSSQSWELVGGARYMHLWRWMPGEGQFRLDQSYSYDHGAALKYPLPDVDGPEE